jgi:hypothetical protein
MKATNSSVHAVAKPVFALFFHQSKHWVATVHSNPHWDGVRDSFANGWTQTSVGSKKTKKNIYAALQYVVQKQGVRLKPFIIRAPIEDDGMHDLVRSTQRAHTQVGKNARPPCKPVDVTNAHHANPTPSKRRFRFVSTVRAKNVPRRFGFDFVLLLSSSKLA